MASVAEDPEGESVQRVVVTDVSDRKRMESALLKKNAELETARSWIATA